MVSTAAVQGGRYTVFEPDIDSLISAGYTAVRIYWASSEDGSYSLVSTQTLVSGTYTYTYNKTDALAGDWAYHAYYGATPGEGPASEPMPIGPPRTATRKAIRQGVGRRLRIVDILTTTTITDADTFICAAAIDPDASAFRYANRFARLSSGTYAGDVRRLRTTDSSPAGYVPSTGTFNTGRAFSGTPTVGDEVELWRPKEDEDPSTLIDEACNRAARFMWWEDSIFLAASESTSDYSLPGILRNERFVKAAEYCADTYPTRPLWTPVPYWKVRKRGQQGIITLEAGSGGMRRPFATGTIFQVTVNRQGDILQSDSDYWEVELEWAIAQVAWNFLHALGTPGAGWENIIDVKEALKSLEAELAYYRSVFMPMGAAQEDLPV